MVIIFICVDHCHCTPVSLMPFALFFFQAPACPIMLSRPEDLPEHHAVHPDVPPAEMAVREMETDRVLTARDIFGVVADCGAGGGQMRAMTATGWSTASTSRGEASEKVFCF